MRANLIVLSVILMPFFVHAKLSKIQTPEAVSVISKFLSATSGKTEYLGVSGKNPCRIEVNIENDNISATIEVKSRFQILFFESINSKLNELVVEENRLKARFISQLRRGSSKTSSIDLEKDENKILSATLKLDYDMDEGSTTQFITCEVNTEE